MGPNDRAPGSPALGGVGTGHSPAFRVPINFEALTGIDVFIRVTPQQMLVDNARR